VLARAYRATGDLRYARGVREQLESWRTSALRSRHELAQPLELAIRLINWSGRSTWCASRGS